ncbi:FAD binding domain-containing protein [Bradyrhizobium sp. 14AA]
MPFEYERPKSWDEAVVQLSEPGVIAKMGGCDVLTRFRRGKLAARKVLGLNLIPGITEIEIGSDGARIGAGVTLRQLEMSADFQRGWPTLHSTLRSLASPAIRSVASLVGNVTQGWSQSDIVPLLQVSDARLMIVGPRGQRHLSVAEFAGRSKNDALRPDELVRQVELPAAAADTIVSYERFTFRNAFSLPVVSIAVSSNIKSWAADGGRIAVSGLSRMPRRCPEAEEVMRVESGRADVDSVISSIAASVNPISDYQASAEFRLHLLMVLAKRAFAKLSS